jgi:hypothetical protein
MSFRGVEASIYLERFSNRKFDTSPPYSEFLQMLINSRGLEEVIGKSHNLDAAYLSWLQVRKNGAPLSDISTRKVTFGTGFEGYFVGRVQSEEEMLIEILDMGKNIWDNIRRMHKYSYSNRSTLEKVIRGESYSIQAINEWMAIFGAQLARQRAQIIQNKPALEFREKTKKQILRLPKIDYTLDQSGGLKQTYFLPDENVANNLTFGGMTDEDRLALITMREIGKFGHPLVREAMRLVQQ